MAESKGGQKSDGRAWVRAIVSVVVCVVLLGAAGGAVYVIQTTEPEAESEAATRKTAALVETIQAESGTYRPRLRALGVVEPARDIVLSPRVSGQIVSVEDGFVPGGLVEAGQALLAIDPVDFERMLTMRISEMEQAQATLAIEEGRQAAARLEFELLGEDVDPANRDLVLRVPQIKTARAQLQAAEAAVEQARLDLERATIRAPFAAQILSRSANIGSQVSPGEELARLVGIDEYWIMASVALRDLRWVNFPGDGEEGARVEVRHTTAWEPGVTREGRVSGLIGTVDQESRLARVLVTVPDPLARDANSPALIIGSIVELRIVGEPLEGVVRLSRAYLRQNDTVWVMVDNALDIREVEVVFSDAEYAYIASGLEAGEHVVTTSLATVTEGLGLRREGEPAPSPSEDGGSS